MMSSRGMGAINPSKMPTAKKVKRRDSTDFTQYAATTKAKRAGKAAGKQFVAQPKRIAKKTAGFR